MTTGEERNAVRGRSVSARLSTLAGIGIVLVLLGVAQVAAGEGDAPGMGFPDLEEGLKSVPGCLGVETAQTSSGKSVIFAWFEDKQAVLKWYNSEMHQQVLQQFFADSEHQPPLHGVPDDSGPIMAIASITFSDETHFETTQLPISQIAIELYAPIPGGIFLGGRFAPESLTVEGMRDMATEGR